jgi:hypothetical protein
MELPSTNPKPEEVGPVAQGHVNLLTGIELKNWKADEEHKKHWSFRDYVLVYDGKGNEQTLWSDKEYGDFELIADWRLSASKEKPKGTNNDRCGLVVRSGDRRLRLSALASGQVSVMDESASEVEREGIVTEKPPAKPSGQWNRLLARMERARVVVFVNGDRVVAIDRLKVPAKGPIALFAHGGPVEFANVFVRELKKE